MLKKLNYLAVTIMEGEDITPKTLKCKTTFSLPKGKHNNDLCCRYWRQIWKCRDGML